jgi:UDP:flavonoid glycosyltransferase YjiC (YdhE family)
MSNSTLGRRKKILFFAEAVTLAHIARPAVLAGVLDEEEFEVVLARDPRYDSLFPDLTIRQQDLYSIPSAAFLDALARGAPLYSADILEKYVEEDLRLIDREKPDIVVGDFRLSLSISARLRDIPYVAIANAHWSPYARPHYVIPEHPMTRLLGVPMADALFRAIRPAAFAMHSLPLNRVRRRYGLSSLGMNLNRVYTDADRILYADVPQLIKMVRLPDSHRFIGPVLWSPEHHYPDWWGALDRQVPTIYLTLGSSGRSDLLPTVVDAIRDMPIQILVSTAGLARGFTPAPNLFIADFLPGDAASRKASLVICNGGSLTTYQALAHSKPVLGIAGNLDQHLNMGGVEQLGAGIRLRTDRLSPGRVRQAVQTLLEEQDYAQCAGVLQKQIGEFDAGSRFTEVLRSV